MERYPRASDLRFEQAFIEMQNKLVDEARRYVGAPTRQYRTPEMGVSPEEGFDCSGFITFVLKQLSIPVSADIRHSDEYFRCFGDFVHEGFQRSGDLVFFSKNGIFPTHMGLLTGEHRFIHAPGLDGLAVCEEVVVKRSIPVNDSYKIKQIYGSNPIGYKRIVIPDLRLKIR